MPSLLTSPRPKTPELKTRNVSYSWLGYPVKEIQSTKMNRFIHNRSRLSLVIWSGSPSPSLSESGLVSRDEVADEGKGEDNGDSDEVLIIELRSVPALSGMTGKTRKRGGHNRGHSQMNHVVEFSRCSKKTLNPCIMETSQWAGTTSWSLLAIVRQAITLTLRGTPYKGTTFHLSFEDNQSFVEELAQIITTETQPQPQPRSTSHSDSDSDSSHTGRETAITKTTKTTTNTALAPTKIKIIRDRDVLADSVWTLNAPPTLALLCDAVIGDAQALDD
ncbi:hypothetical protein D9758_009146 [Tetrapyrgos nigripes]|uniref:Uncharacterized protein n=1 Tax=Tetrapyrgos nigripes TaxID=182062 RepID=A0A8H5G8L7_9AGAR|nr:hypothetical protein D9758_009146 [Tetrapyrgos nigripes]